MRIVTYLIETIVVNPYCKEAQMGEAPISVPSKSISRPVLFLTSTSVSIRTFSLHIVIQSGAIFNGIGSGVDRRIDLAAFKPVDSKRFLFYIRKGNAEGILHILYYSRASVR
jgi:hypothetical protein